MTRVPDQQLLVIADGSKEVGVLAMPGHVTDGPMRRLVRHLGGETVALLGGGADVPQADLGIVGSTQKVASRQGRPGQTIAFGLMAGQDEIGLGGSVGGGLGGVTGVVEDVDFGAHRLGGDDELFLGHVTRAVDFAVVVDLSDDLDLAVRAAIASDFVALLVVLALVKFRLLQWELDLSQHQIVLSIVGGVGSQDKLLLAVPFVVVVIFVWKPLDRKTGPLQVMSNN
mmetsp:Transcript_2092/g.3134  ORF Transcript_2092/g.3134 Transcript_2092/m.3134 type:complete len:227 (+) Transcript_2092:959-1639(+)